MTGAAVPVRDAVREGAAASRAWFMPALYAGLCLALIAAMLWSIASGRFAVSFAKVIAILIAPLTGQAPSWTPTEAIVVNVVRLPRLLTAAIAGASLSLCGAVLQGLFRNPLVGPQTIGISSGAALGGVAAIMFVGFGMLVPLGAFAGAALALVAVIALQRSDGASPVLTLVLAGIVVSAFCGALVGLVTYIADPETKLPDIVYWLLGSFAAATWPKLLLVAGWTSLAAIVMIGMRWRINVLSLGDEEARTLGINPGRDRLILMAAACIAVSAQVAVSGIIGWVGLVVPNLARQIVGADHRRLLPVSALLGAIFLVVADTLSRDLTAAEIPVGIVTAIVGTPIFAILLRQTTRSGAA